MTETNGFEEWCLLELMGHQRIAGRVTEATIGGQSFLRVDVPEAEGRQALTKYYGAGAVYCMTPISEAVARHLADSFAHQPVSRWDLPRLPQPGEEDDDPDEYADEDEHGGP